MSDNGKDIEKRRKLRRKLTRRYAKATEALKADDMKRRQKGKKKGNSK